MTPKPTAVLVSHTHWDRAWYMSFPRFRFRLVHMIDRILDLLDRDPDFRCFVLDGQVALVEDYLELAPEREPDLARLVRAGRLVIGPWYVLPDLFLQDPEAVIRNLRLGLRISSRFGDPLRIGYVPDPFGHFAQLPQVLNGFGIDTFIFMRGMPLELRRHNTLDFDWVAPDGSSVRAYYLIEGYFNASALGHPHVIGRFDGLRPDPDRAETQIRETLDKLGRHEPAELFLLNNGLDHMPEQPELPALLRDLRQRIPDVDIVHGSFSDFMERLLARPARHRHTGDLLDNPDHPILSSVLSTRVYLKQQNHLATSRLVRYAEPMQALAAGLLGDRAPDPHRFLERAWKRLLQNHPHDDICGCSVDEVHDANEVRYSEVLDLSDSTMEHLLEQLALTGFDAPAHASAAAHAPAPAPASGPTSTPTPDDTPAPVPPRHRDLFAFNPHPFPLEGTFGARVVFANHEGEEEVTLPRHELRLLDADGAPLPVRVLDTQAPTLKAEFIQLTWGRAYQIEFDAQLPPLGYKVLRVEEAQAMEQTGAEEKEKEKEKEMAESPQPAAHSGPNSPLSPAGTLSNDLFHIDYTANTLRVTPLEQPDAPWEEFLRLEHQLDNGDTYSFSAADDRVTPARLDAVRPSATRSRTLLLTYTLTAPEALDRPDPVTQLVDIELHLPFSGAIELSASYQNRLRDCRLRALLPASLPTGPHASHTWADGPFRVARHAVVPAQSPADHPDRYASYPGELPYSTHFMGDYCFVEHPNGANWLSAKGLHEYELTGDRLALTLHRAVGWLSVRNGTIRRPHAGPKVPTPGAQCQRPLSAHFAFGTLAQSAASSPAADPATPPSAAPISTSTGHEALPPVPALAAAIARRARAFCHPAWIREFPVIAGLPATGPLPASHSLLTLSDPAVQLASLRQSDPRELPSGATQWVLRLVNPSDSARTCEVRLSLPATRRCPALLDELWDDARAADLPADGSFTLRLAPYAIETILLRT